MRLLALFFAVGLVGCSSLSTESTQAAKKPSSVYVQVVGPDGLEVTTDMASTIREEAYNYYQTIGLTPSRSLVDADMTVVFKANEIALRDAVKVSVDRAKMGKGKDIWVTVNGDEGIELNNPIADVIKAQTYAEFAQKGFQRAPSANDADLKISVFTNDQTLRAAVRKALTRETNTKTQ